MSARVIVAFSLLLSVAFSCSSDPEQNADASTGQSLDASARADASSAPGADAAQPAGLDASQPAGSDAATPAGRDASTAGPDASTEGVECGSSVCTGSQLCCLRTDEGYPTFECAASCEGAAGTVSCDGPGDCDNNQFCCNVYTLGSGTFPSCEIAAATISCTDTCDSQFQQQCSASGTMRVCQAKADCVESTYSNCCPSGVGGYMVCLPYVVGGCLE
ncbi:MAG: hypothetical protein HY901_36550 [Deltaproteobacteria bacterium]|nr:hypothetical protein [Deltaproteobacteria bacterium]